MKVGRLGGNRTLQLYGRDHFSKLGKARWKNHGKQNKDIAATKKASTQVTKNSNGESGVGVIVGITTKK